MDTTGYTPVTDAGGKVLGWMAPADAETPHEKQFRNHVVGVRAAAVDEVADLALAPGFDLDDVCADGEARIGEAGVDAALGVAWELMQVEELRH
jgi:hypothetical protein